MKEIKNKLEDFKKIDDIHQYQKLLDITDDFIAAFPSGVSNEIELDLGIDLLKELISLTYIGSLHQYEHNYKLQNEILKNKIKVFKLCIPESHAKLRGLTEMLLGMKENSVG